MSALGPERGDHPAGAAEPGGAGRDTVFATAVYGAGYERFLSPHLACVSAAHPDARICVCWGDVPAREIELLRRVHPAVELQHLPRAIEGSPAQRIARKLHAWSALAERFPDARLVLLDCDALLVKPISAFFGEDYDVLFTWKDEPFVLNTGVVLFRDGRTAAPFLREWTARCERIASDEAALRRACEQSGAADQHALRELIGFANYDGLFSRRVGDRDYALRGVPCRLLNETNSVPIGEDTHVVHYKAGWRPILFEGRRESAGRPEALCRDMLRFWRDTVARAEREAVHGLVERACATHAERFAAANAPYEERGILSSELLAVCGVCDELGVDVVVESGRCRGQSTLVLARYFEGRATRIVSFELERDENAAVAERRLARYGNAELRFGDSLKEIPDLVRSLRSRRVAVLLDGPKGVVALRFLQALFRDFDNVVAGFLHDTRRETVQRELCESECRRAFFTDAEDFVARHRHLDEGCLPRPGAPITLHTWRPYRKGEDEIPSYGPTLAVLLPSPHDPPLPAEDPARPRAVQGSALAVRRWLGTGARALARRARLPDRR